MELATLAGGALLSATFELLLSKLNSSVSEWLNSPKQVRSEMQNWKNVLPEIGALLDHAEEKQVTDPLVKLWLADLKDLAYDMKDILEEVEIDAKRSEIAKTRGSNSRKLIPFSFNKVSTCMHGQERDMASRVKNITARLRHIEARTSTLSLIHSAMRTGDKFHKVSAERLPAPSLPENHVYGRESDKTDILHMLFDDESNEGDFVIPIIGMGGIGKTTLARLVYNDEKVKAAFGLKVWVCVSKEFDVHRITRAISEQVGVECLRDLTDLPLLQERLREKLSSQKFLLVLDDIWNENYDRWDNLQRPFLSAVAGSKIIVTMRNEDIGRMIRGNDGVYNLALLEDDACLSLFARHALGAENFDAHPNLKVVGEKLVEKCKRLPLALKTLGGLLHGKLRHDQWENLLNSEIWDLREDNSDILPALRLSYNHLPSYLKRCFGYCALFPKDYEFEEGELVLLWMAEGLFQQQPHRMKQIKDLGHQYFRDLVSRAFFQQSSRDESLFVMHDLMRDLALYVTGKTCCTIELEGNKLDVISQEARHLSFFPCVYEVSKRFDILKKPNSLRTFLRLKTEDDYHSDYYLSNLLFQDLLQNLKRLRLLSLDKYQVRKLVDSIGDLQHLRYINLSCTLIESLPDSIGFLIYLQTLLLRDCAMLSKLPRTMGNIHDLQHFDITETPSLEEMPLEINNLTNLVTLPKFIIGNGRGLRVKDLKNLSRLQGQLSILNLENVSDARDAREANLYEIKGLDDLSLEWSFDHLNSQNDSNQMQVVSWLKPHEGLKRLKINCFGGLELPSWIGHPSFFNLKFLELRNCQRSTSLASLGQLPQLKELIITGMHAIEIMTLDFDGDTFSSIEAFQSLESMELQDCPMLVGKLPKCLLSLKRLKIAKCPKLMYSLTSLPSLEELYIEACSEVVLRSMVNLTSLKTLRISRISYLTCLPRSFVESMILLEDMEVKECNELTCLWEEGAILNLACLKRMTVINCPLVVSLTMKKQGLLPDSIQTLEIHNCPALESLPTEVMMMVQLEDLHISGCLSLNCFPSGHLPTSLKCLSISNCTKLEFIHERMLQYCRELEGMSVGGGMNMKSLPFLQYMHGLTFLWIDNCEGLESFPERGMSMSIPNLRRLWVENCINLKYLPNRMHDLTLLDELIISNSPGIEAIPDGGFPRNLTWLTIDCKNLKQPVQEWGLCELTSLLYCEIHWICPPDDILSNSITTLVVKNVENLKSISGDLLKNMNSLQNLFLEHWPKLRSLPNESLPPLQKLYIVDCPKLRSFPKDGLPPSLGGLLISNCPLLKRRCLEKKGGYWPLIAHIPCVVTNDDSLPLPNFRRYPNENKRILMAREI